MIYQSKTIKGFGRGKETGFPAFNLVVPKSFVKKPGAYCARVKINQKEYAGALHFGTIPTFNDPKPTLGVFVLDYKDNQPIEEIEFEILGYVRPILVFETPAALSAQIAKDIIKIRKIYQKRG